MQTTLPPDNKIVLGILHRKKKIAKEVEIVGEKSEKGRVTFAFDLHLGEIQT